MFSDFFLEVLKSLRREVEVRNNHCEWESA